MRSRANIVNLGLKEVRTDMQIIGHRGAAGLADENSLEAINQALKLKIDAIELDVRLLNGVLILAHDEPMPSDDYIKLETALAAIPKGQQIILDIKESIAEEVYAATKQRKNDIVYSSRSFRVLRRLREMDDSINLATIESWSSVRAVAESVIIGSKRLHLKYSWLWGSLVRSLTAQGYEVYAYTVNSRAKAAELEEWGVAGIFTDHPDRFK